MSEFDHGGPAFPTHAGADWGKDPRDLNRDDPRNRILGGGMTIRDWFAGQALAGACAVWYERACRTADPDAEVAQWAYEIADAMIAARAKEASHDRT